MENKKVEKEKDYIDRHHEWQRNQFSPGHFTGGNIPVWLQKPGRAKRLGVAYLIFGLFFVVWEIYYFVQLYQAGKTTEEIFALIFYGIVAVVAILAGIRFVRR